MLLDAVPRWQQQLLDCSHVDDDNQQIMRRSSSKDRAKRSAFSSGGSSSNVCCAGVRWPRWMRRRGCVRVMQLAVAAAIVVILAPMIIGSGTQTPKLNSHDSEDDERPVKREAKQQTTTRPDILDVDDPSAAYRGRPKIDWHDYNAMEADEKRTGPGEQGQAVHLPDDEETKKKQDALYRVNGFDAMASDLVPVDRSVKDVRAANCKKRKYIDKLPTVTVIFPSHNEHNSTLLRSIYSLINRSPKELLREIVVVDDASTKDFLKKPLEDYLERTGLDKIVKIVRTGKREGLIRARQIGARHATSDVMVFLDSHSEANYNWLPALIEPIALDYRTVVCPFVDVVDCDTFEYRPQDEGARGSFDWEFNYKRLPRVDPAQRTDPSEPFDSPVMAGGYFAINRKWFWELGGYDDGLDIWGGEQYELSFKVWQCHGRMVDAPCSRVGHIYRCKYVPFPNPNVGDFISRNYRRVAEVWMDEYAEHLYKRRPLLKTTDPGDLTKQKDVRSKHRCKSFKWFMENVAFDQDKFYPAVEPPDGANGRIISAADPQKCIDVMGKGKEEEFGLYPCNKGNDQKLRLSFWQDIRPSDRSMCFDVSRSTRKAPVVMFPCHGMQGNQWWKYKKDTRHLFHPVSHQCLQADLANNKIYMEPCDDEKETQKWNWENVDWAVMAKWKDHR